MAPATGVGKRVTPAGARRSVRSGTVRRLLAPLATLALLAPACAAASGAGAAGPRYVVVGASDAAGYGADRPVQEAWPQVLRASIPPGSGVVNLAVPGATVADALTKELPAAVAADADVALVWLAVDDVLHRVSPAAYERQLGRLVHALRRHGDSRVLVGNTPPLDRLPAYLACRTDPACPYAPVPAPAELDATVGAYNAAVARVVRAAGAELVDLHAAGVAARRAGTDASLVAADGFHPSTAGHRLIADTFARALRRRH